MKKIIVLLFVLSVSMLNAQAYKGKGDIKFQVGALLQSWGTGIVVGSDFGMGENISFGFITSYLLSVKDQNVPFDNYTLLPDPNDPAFMNSRKLEPEFVDRIDIKARFNANIGNVIGLPSNMDVYTGLSLGLRNFGGHAGFRYFFTNGFGVYGEAGFPIAKYDQNVTDFDKLNNQFTFAIGASFNL
jgi:hypothetical protein